MALTRQFSLDCGSVSDARCRNPPVRTWNEHGIEHQHEDILVGLFLYFFDAVLGRVALRASL